MATATVTPRTRKHVCTFDELSGKAKENAREWMRDCEMETFDPDCVIESAVTAAKIIGIEFANAEDRWRNKVISYRPDIRWSGFSSQGDGASFVGSYSHAPNSPAKIREEFGTDTKLWAIADGLDALQNGYKLLTGHRINAKVEQSGSYVHQYTMSVDVEDSETGDQLDIRIQARVQELMRDFAGWIYKQLEEEWDYRLTDEAIEDAIRANEYSFNAATGKVV